jgi:hypothetical protein
MHSYVHKKVSESAALASGGTKAAPELYLKDVIAQFQNGH